MQEIIEIGTVSSRGQIAIPSGIRKNMGIKEGSKVLFLLQDNSLVVKKVNTETFAEITKPLKEAAKKSGLKESESIDIVHRFRKEKKR